MSFFDFCIIINKGDMMKLRKAVLLIHGFAGGTYDMESLAWSIQKRMLLDVYQFTLPGHAHKENCTYKDWINAVKEKMETLISYGYSSIYVVGHSMGGVLASLAATEYSEVKKIVLAAPAFKYVGEKENFSFKKTTSIIQNYGIDEVIFRGFERLPITAINELAALVKNSQELPKKIKKPILIFQGTKDDIVPVTSSEYVFDNVESKLKSLVYLEESNHDIFNGSQKDLVNKKIEKFLLFNKISGPKEYV